MKYRTTLTPVSDARELAPPDDDNLWYVHSCEREDNQLFVLWQFDDVSAAAVQEHETRYRTKFAHMESELRRLQQAFGELAQYLPDRFPDAPAAIRAELAVTAEVLRAHGEGHLC